MSEELDTNAAAPEGWSVVESGEYKAADGSSVEYDVAQSPDGNVQRMVEKPAAEPEPAAMEFDWGDEEDGATPQAPKPDKVEQLTPEQQAIQAKRNQWQELNPGQSIYSPEGKSVGPEDIARLEAEAKGYNFDNFDRKNIAEVYEAIRQSGPKRAAELRDKLQADGEDYSSEVIEQIVARETAKAVADSQKKVLEGFFPDPPEGTKKREVKLINQKRQKLAALLSKSPEEFAALQADWQVYEDIAHTRELDRQHGLALEDDKNLRSREETARLKVEMSELDDRNGGALEALSGLAVASDARAAELMAKFKEKTSRHQGDRDLLDADKLQTFHDMKWRLGELLAAPDKQGRKLSDAEVAARTQELAPALEDWLEAAVGAESDPLADLKLYEQKKTAFEGWDRRHRQAAEYLGPVIIFNTVRNMLRSSQEKKSEEPTDASGTVKVLLDPQGIGENNGAHALRKAGELTEEDADIYQAGIIGQLETARNYGRHQGNVLKAALMVNALAIGTFESLASSWDKLPSEEKRRAWKKSALGKLGTGLALRKKIAVPKKRWFQSDESFRKEQAKTAAAAAKEAA